MKYLIQFQCILITLTVTSSQSTLADSFLVKRNPCEQVRNGQFICVDCATLGFCSQQNGVWTTLTVGSCNMDQNLFCDEQAHGCIFRKTCKTKTMNIQFECQNPGIYPDPDECEYYYECSESNEAKRYTCPSGTAYSPVTKTCSIPGNHEICLKPQYNCTVAGQSAAWPTDANIFYICMGQKPLLYSCPLGFSFINGKCKVLYRPPSQGDVCNDENIVSADPDDCRSYFNCIEGIFVKTSCPKGSYFNPHREICVFGSC